MANNSEQKTGVSVIIIPKVDNTIGVVKDTDISICRDQKPIIRFLLNSFS